MDTLADTLIELASSHEGDFRAAIRSAVRLESIISVPESPDHLPRSFLRSLSAL